MMRLCLFSVSSLSKINRWLVLCSASSSRLHVTFGAGFPATITDRVTVVPLSTSSDCSRVKISGAETIQQHFNQFERGLKGSNPFYMHFYRSQCSLQLGGILLSFVMLSHLFSDSTPDSQIRFLQTLDLIHHLVTRDLTWSTPKWRGSIRTRATCRPFFTRLVILKTLFAPSRNKSLGLCIIRRISSKLMLLIYQIASVN